MKLLHALSRRFPHKYAIDAKRLGDERTLAWSNLGFWSDTSDYKTACCQLAERLADSVQLSSKDRLLDLGCGQGASLQHWVERYQIQSVCAVELQPDHVKRIQHTFPQIEQIIQGSFLDLTPDIFRPHFDVVICIDAAYHSPLNLFIKAAESVLNSKGRLGFHYLILSEKWAQLPALQRQKYKYLLKAANVDLDDLADFTTTEQCLQANGFDQIQIVDITTDVFAGFANYMASRPYDSKHNIDEIKIRATAKLCQYLYDEGIVRYVQIAATKQE